MAEDAGDAELTGTVADDMRALLYTALIKGAASGTPIDGASIYLAELNKIAVTAWTVHYSAE